VAALYLDTSAAAKMYMAERGTRWMRSVCSPLGANQLITVRLTAPELIAAFARRTRGGLLSGTASAGAIARVRWDWTWRFIILDVDEFCIAEAMNVAERRGLRGYDAVHVAAALIHHRDRLAGRLPPLIFISADPEQLRAALAEGMLVDDPNQHP
jgi:predicted nucleic acid-binding protein